MSERMFQPEAGDTSTGSHPLVRGEGACLRKQPSSYGIHRLPSCRIVCILSTRKSPCGKMRSLGRSHACGDKRNSRRRSSPQEEKGELEKELEKLQAELIGLTYRALSRTAARSRGDSQHPRRALHRDSTEDVLRDAIKIQQLSLASVQAVLSTYVVTSTLSSFRMHVLDAASLIVESLLTARSRRAITK